MIYAIYKYEISLNAEIRDVMKGTISVEHILPQNWQWIKENDEFLSKISIQEWESFSAKIDQYINGIGNLLLVTRSENSSVSNNHPAEKIYERYKAGSYAEHNAKREDWRSANEWSELIKARGKKIYDFILTHLVDSADIQPNIPMTLHESDSAGQHSESNNPSSI
jgi:hypothetical protein